jgi:hypothetical protein
MRKTAAWPLAWVYAGLVVYASLYPFEGWRDQGVSFHQFVTAPWPRYWTGFDVVSNVLGYMPLGFLLALALLRSRNPSRLRTGVWRQPVLVAWLLACSLSGLMEALQSFLPARVPSQLDGLLNALGAWLGAVLAAGMERWGLLSRWSRFRARWFLSDASGSLVLMALWPLALLYPAAVPLGLGQVFERLQQELSDWMVGVSWWPSDIFQPAELLPLMPGTELLCVSLGLLVPCLLGLSIASQRAARWLMCAGVLLCALVASALSAALSFGPVHAWAWVTPQVLLGLGLGAAICALLIVRQIPPRVSAALMLLALGANLSIINQAPEGAYFAHTLQSWEQGRFIRFHGVGQWLGWLWPYAALMVVTARLWAHEEGR